VTVEASKERPNAATQRRPPRWPVGTVALSVLMRSLARRTALEGDDHGCAPRGPSVNGHRSTVTFEICCDRRFGGRWTRWAFPSRVCFGSYVKGSSCLQR
jgi:hypothetical protein